MKILMVNNQLSILGGSETYMFSIGAELAKRGHDVQYFGKQDPNNEHTNKYGIYAKNSINPFSFKLNKHNVKQFAKLLDLFKPDIVHINLMYFVLTPAIVDEAYKRNIPVIHTVHDPKIVCPNHRLYISQTEQPCMLCLKNGLHSCVKNKCVKNSRLLSKIATNETEYYRKNGLYKRISKYIFPSEFMKNIHIGYDVDEEKSIVLHNFSRIKTVNNILLANKIAIKKSLNKIKTTSAPKSDKKIYKSKSRTKINISNYLLNYRKKSNSRKVNNKKLNRHINNSAHKFHLYNDSTSINNNLTNKSKDKTTSIYPRNYHILSNDSTLEYNNGKKSTACGHTTSKKSKFNNQFFDKEKKINIKFSKLNRLKNKSNEIKDIILNKKNINNRFKLNLDNSFSKKSFNIINSEKNDNMNYNYINNTENNIIYTKTESNHIYFHDCNISDKTLSKIDNISTTNNKSIDINMNITNNKIRDDNIINNFNQNKDNNFEYIKKIEKLENENKILKNEINDSKYKLQLLEDKINKLLLGRSAISLDKEECPQPTPYVKKYSSGVPKNNN